MTSLVWQGGVRSGWIRAASAYEAPLRDSWDAVLAAIVASKATSYDAYSGIDGGSTFGLLGWRTPVGILHLLRGMWSADHVLFRALFAPFLSHTGATFVVSHHGPRLYDRRMRPATNWQGVVETDVDVRRIISGGSDGTEWTPEGKLRHRLWADAVTGTAAHGVFRAQQRRQAEDDLAACVEPLGLDIRDPHGAALAVAYAVLGGRVPDGEPRARFEAFVRPHLWDPRWVRAQPLVVQHLGVTIPDPLPWWRRWF